VLKNGVDPLSLLHYLTSLGEITHLTTLADTLPAADAMDPECCYLGFEIGFQTRASKAQIEQVFDEAHHGKLKKRVVLTPNF